MTKSIHTQQHIVLCDALRNARKAAGVTQAQMAQSLRRPQSFVAKYELGERRLDLIELLQIADILSIDLSVLIDVVRTAGHKKRR